MKFISETLLLTEKWKVQTWPTLKVGSLDNSLSLKYCTVFRSLFKILSVDIHRPNLHLKLKKIISTIQLVVAVA